MSLPEGFFVRKRPDNGNHERNKFEPNHEIREEHNAVSLPNPPGIIDDDVIFLT